MTENAEGPTKSEPGPAGRTAPLVLLALANVPALLLTAWTASPAGEAPPVPLAALLLAVASGLLGSVLLWVTARRCVRRLQTARQAYLEQGDLLAILLESAAGILICDDRGHIDTLNDAAARLFGYTSEELRGVSIGRLLASDPDALSALSTSEQRVLGIGRTLTGWRKDGTRLQITMAVSKVRRGGVIHYTVIVHDLSELHRAREQAEAASRTGTALLANVSHELRTPLNGILGMADALRDTSLDGEQRRLLDALTGSAEALSSQVLQLLDYARIETGDLVLASETFSLRGLVDDVLSPLQIEAAGRGIRLGSHVAGDLPERAVGDPGRLGQVLGCLVGNAIKFTERGSVAVLLSRTGQSHGQPNQDRNGVHRPPTFLLQIEVTDTGIGIPEQVRDRVFAAFSQADSSATRQHGGLGLGLALINRLVRLMGGQIQVESAVGEGSTFRVVVPLGLPEGTELGPARPSILVVLANEDERREVIGLVTGWGWSAVGVDTAQSALVQFCEAAIRGSPYRLIVAEETLPDEPVQEFLAKLGSWQKRCPTILLRGQDGAPEDLPDMVVETLPRNVRPARLREAILRGCSPPLTAVTG